MFSHEPNIIDHGPRIGRILLITTFVFFGVIYLAQHHYMHQLNAQTMKANIKEAVQAANEEVAYFTATLLESPNIMQLLNSKSPDDKTIIAESKPVVIRRANGSLLKKPRWTLRKDGLLTYQYKSYFLSSQNHPYTYFEVKVKIRKQIGITGTGDKNRFHFLRISSRPVYPGKTSLSLPPSERTQYYQIRSNSTQEITKAEWKRIRT